tara:strand:- start:3175 stop:3465 length:291 start_codon:yes stop_codon:yes gene_type:complete
LNKLIKIFKAKSSSHLLLIFIIFGISGSLSVFVSGPIIKYLKIESLFSYYPIYFIFRVFIIFPVYQLVLIIVASIFGQYKYFLEFEKKLFKRFKFF